MDAVGRSLKGQARRQLRRLARSALTVVAVCVVAGSIAPPAGAQIVGRYAYRLVDNWRERPWSLQPGHFGYAADISSGSDGAVYVLDRLHVVVHQLSANHVPLRAWPLPYQAAGAGWTPEKLDVDYDGSLLVLAGETGKRGGRSRVDRLAPDGTLRDTIELEVDYNDVAGLPGGGFALSRSYPLAQPTPEPRSTPVPEKGGVDLFSAAGRRLLTLDDRPLFYAVAVDVAPDGTLLTLVRIPNPSSDVPPPFPPTPQPSGRRQLPDPAAGRMQQGGAPLTPLEGVAVYAADHRFVATWFINNAEDVAVGPAAVKGPGIEGLAPAWAAFVSRHLEVFRAGSLDPVYSGPVGQLTSPFYGGAPLHLDVAASGRLRASIAECYHQGGLDFDRPLAANLQPRLFGALDRPPLAGPVYPLRVDGGPPPAVVAPAVPGGVGGAQREESLVVLQGRFMKEDDVLGVAHYFGRPDAEFDQSAQRWSAAGALQSEMGVCGGTAASWSPERSDVWWVRDIARDGSDVYTIDPYLLRFRPDNGFPGWTYWPAASAAEGEGSRLVAVSADAGRVAVLDNGLAEVIILSRSGALVARWSLGGGQNRLAVDLALRGSRVFVADAGENEVHVYELRGRRLDAWPLHDGPAAIDVGGGDEVAVLGRSGWAFRYTADGWQEAAWPPPAGDAEPLDIAVGPEGRVFIPYSQRVYQSVGLRDETIYEIVDAGIWVFDPVALPIAPPPAAGACWARPDKSAAPSMVRLGDTVGVDLAIRGACPGHGEPLDLVILFDTSRSMNWDGALIRGQDVALRLLSILDPAADEAALVTFSDGPTVSSGLTRDFGQLARKIAGLEAVGDTRVAGAMAGALTLLTSGSSRPGERRAVVMITDSDFNDDALSAAAPLKAAGIELFALVVSTPRFDSGSANRMAAITGSRSRVLVNPDTGAIRRGLDLARHYVDQPTLFQTITITDVVPGNMEYVAGSAVPVADFAATAGGGGVLAWQLSGVEVAKGLRLNYRLRPLETGTWPTNVGAYAVYRDGAGKDGQLAFPVPTVDVWDLAGLRFHAYLPAALRGICQLRSEPLDVVLVIDASESMGEVDASGQVKLQAARVAANQFARLLDLAKDRVGAVSFNSAAESRAALMNDPVLLERSLNGIGTAPGTRIDLGLGEAEAMLTRSGRLNVDAAVVLLTDGLQSGPRIAVNAAAASLRRRAQLYAIGLGNEIDRDLLRSIVSVPSGYRESPDAGQLADIYAEVSKALACGK